MWRFFFTSLSKILYKPAIGLLGVSSPGGTKYEPILQFAERAPVGTADEGLKEDRKNINQLSDNGIGGTHGMLMHARKCLWPKEKKICRV